MTKKSSHSSLSRREFLRRAAALGGAAALAAALESCTKLDTEADTKLAPTSFRSTETRQPMAASPTASAIEQPSPTLTEPLPSVTPDEGKARIAFVKTNNRASGVRRAIDLLGINPVSGKRVFLKPNFNSADPTPGSTHPDVLSALVTALKDMGAQSITVGDRSGMGNTRHVMEKLGIFKLADEIGFDTLVFDDLSAEEWVKIEPPDSHWSQGFYFAKPILDADALVSTCCLKTHQYGGHFTMSLKLAVGMVGNHVRGVDHGFMNELHSSADQRKMIAEINTAYSPALIVLDGVEAFISGGPGVGEKANPGVILAGTDRVAIDAVGVALLRYFGCQTEAARGKIFEQEQIARAVELGLGVDNPEMIEFITTDEESKNYAESIRNALLE